ncbi:MAG TPA: CocE/NonD family hydrolase [Blastocatellia bacterium]|nr:CocE/NonD family hydrolase [Blastocatellia bacterium]HMX24260.1 CocE/NonD family hydrolase [Blastocatellia bacterium]HMZ19366.1 CocE/NonD family hydrolase [Blastocatellia bacterium]HNG29295.1 CocE/NonD family hydrolase [Blastocatellia bacterium]
MRERYTKFEYQIPMRDGVRLFTSIYAPKDTSRTYPFLLTRTPYSVAPYGIDSYRASLGPSEHFEKEGFIFVYQDARGRYMSEGEFQQVRPHVPVKRSNKDIDESTDTYDTIEWLLKNIPNNNGKVGMVGVSQPGFHVAAGMIDSHPALKAASPQAPTADYYINDDVYHNGALMLSANFGFYSGFQPRKGAPAPPKERNRFDMGTPDGYNFYLNLPLPMSEWNQKLFGGEATYWQEIIDHPNYDEFWQKRSLWKFMKNVNCAVLNVGGWFDAEDPMGPFHIYRAVEKENPKTENLIVMGPWSHGGWGRGDGDKLGNVNFAVKTGAIFREQIQFEFFMRHLKDKKTELPEAFMFLTGLNEWRRLPAWPPKEAKPMTLFLNAGGHLTTNAPTEANGFDEYLSDPNRPVPHLGYINEGFTRDYMTEDQRFAAQRPDVLVYETAPLTEDLTIAGPIKVSLNVSTTGTDSDFVVKVIDVYPGDYPQPQPAAGQPVPSNSVRMGGYQQLVHGEPFRGKFRNGFEKPEAFTPGKPAAINFAMPDVYHTFRKGHRVMIHVQSSWFPLVDRNPQKFTDIPKAKAEDFQKATQRVYRSREMNSSVTVLVEGQALPTSAGR